MLKTQRVRRSREVAREEILHAAQAAASQTDFSALTVDLVMQGTGMTRSSFYHYFSGLDDLAVGLLEEFEQDIRASVDAWLLGDEDDEDPARGTAHHLTAMFEVMETHRTAVRAVAQAAGGYPNVYREWQRRVLDYFIDLTAAFIRREVARGRSRAEDPERLARSLILMNDAVANDNMMRETPDEPAAIARVISGIWNAAIFGEYA
ncbi:MAG: TetR/AcrR family transcriptional regulator [Myxococcota bacterium]|nr:TetR/AcrR family transcriptional regulator [Myxococcota bacterium]